MTTVELNISRKDQFGRDYDDIPILVQIGDHYVPNRPDVDDVEEVEVGVRGKVVKDCPLYNDQYDPLIGEFLYREGALIVLTDDERDAAEEAYIEEIAGC
jgi:hypothetical protein